MTRKFDADHAPSMAEQFVAKVENKLIIISKVKCERLRTRAKFVARAASETESCNRKGSTSNQPISRILSTSSMVTDTVYMKKYILVRFG